jgi:ATP-binding cassette subfamily F protein 3
MTLLSYADVGVEFGATTLLKNVSFTVGRGERWGVVGRNGAGKTTLFKLITGAMKPTTGAVAKMPGLRVTLLDQHRDFGEATTVWEAAASGYGDVLQLEKDLAKQAERLAELGDKVSEADLEKFGRDQEKFAHAGGYDFHARVDAVLQGLGFDPEDCKTRPLARLSGGERGRVGLAAPLAAPADLLLLDEPTNHLDLDTTRWLTQYLGELGETVIVISHDRAFLDETVDHVLHVSAGTATPYRGGYSAFVQQKAERELTAARALEKHQTFVNKEQDYIRRHLAGQNSAQAKGRRKRLERLPRLSPPPGESGAMNLVLEIGERGGDRVMQAEKVKIAVGDRTLIESLSLTMMRGDVVALIGPNGAGKTTLLSTLLGAREPQAGEIRIGGSITPAWYRQDLAGVPMDGSLFDVIQDLRPLWSRGQIQGLLGAFGFSGDEVLRPTVSLSGGERARVALAMITLKKANLLVLDEPTNHLDVESIEALEDGIEEYEGTTILVSHDRAFLRELATRVWTIRDGKVEDFPGPFVEWEAAEELRRKNIANAASDARRVAATDKAKQQAKATVAAKPKAGTSDADKRAAKKALESAEKNVTLAEATVKELETSLADESLYDGSAEGAKQAAVLARHLDEARRTYEQALVAWEEAVERMG